MWTVANGDCLEVMRSMPDNSVDSVVTDAPYELGFMGKSWDASGVAYKVEVWAEALRVLRPGGYLLAFGGTRTYHRMACAIEDAGFEIRDSLHWITGSGFPKSLNISRAIDKAAGIEFESDETTDEAKEWQGWGTALKPAHEPIVLARKPLAEKTVAANVVEYGTGGLNIDACRIGRAADDKASGWSKTGSNESENQAMSGKNYARDPKPDNDSGRWPANIILDEEAGRELDAQSIVSGMHSAGSKRDYQRDSEGAGLFGVGGNDLHRFGDKGGASRFFYCPKASKKERPTVDGISHPTVKPVALMRWLVRLVTPVDGVVLDPFAGTGATGEACELEGFNSVLIEKEPDHIKLIDVRMAKYGEDEAAA